MERLSLVLDDVSSDHEALLLDGDMLQSVDRELKPLKRLLWLNDDTGVRLRGGARISGSLERPPLVKVFKRNWRGLDRHSPDSALVSAVTSELYFQSSGGRPELCMRGVGPLARQAFRQYQGEYWETAAGEGTLVIADPLFFGGAPALSDLLPPLRVSPLAA